MEPVESCDDVDAYIADAASAAAREKLLQIRKIFREVAPQAQEAISYHMPFYRYNGPLGGFAAYPDHVSLFGAIPDELRGELGAYKVGKGSVQFPIDRPLPVALIAKLITMRARMNESRVRA
jgi:uncharacterized protein YdhG (YjbR/CyaY superfamily)